MQGSAPLLMTAPVHVLSGVLMTKFPPLRITMLQFLSLLFTMHADTGANTLGRNALFCAPGAKLVSQIPTPLTPHPGWRESPILQDLKDLKSF